MLRRLSVIALIAAFPAFAQEASNQTDATQSDTGEAEIILLTEAQLEGLLAPIALYPDTILIQILVGATAPEDLASAKSFLEENADKSQEELSPLINELGLDASVTVLAQAFPDVVTGMTGNPDWTQTVGIAMVNQTDDVMAAVQVLRDQAIQAGSLIEAEEGDEVSEETEQVVSRDANDDITIAPKDPEVVYVPSYDPEVVYVVEDDPMDDLIAWGLFTWATVAIIDDIFDDDDHWHDYWHCRNCGGWGHGPIVWDPDIDIDIDGDVNIGNWDGDRFHNGRPRPYGDRDINIGDRTFNNVNIDTGDNSFVKRDGDKIINNNDMQFGGDHSLNIGDEVNFGDKIDLSGGDYINIGDRVGKEGGLDRDALRGNLADHTGAADISRPDNAGAAAAGAGIAATGAGAAALKNGKGSKLPVKKPAASKKPQLKKPAVKKPAAKPALKKKPAISKKATGGRAKAASHRGGGHMAAKGKRRR